MTLDNIMLLEAYNFNISRKTKVRIGGGGEALYPI